MSDTVFFSPKTPIQNYLKSDTNTSASWTDIRVVGSGRPFYLRAAYWGCNVAGNTIKFYDSGSAVMITSISSSLVPVISFLPMSIILAPPITYYASTASYPIVLFGEFI